VGRPSDPLILVRGKGALLWDSDGNEYIDGTCGLWQCAVGHGRAELADVAAAQMRELEFYASFWDLSNEPSIRLGERLASLSPEGLDTVFYTNGGSEGVETAIKLVRLAWDAAGSPDRDVILSRKAAYHGVGSASLAATGIPPLKEGFGPFAPGFVHLTTPHQPGAGARRHRLPDRRARTHHPRIRSRTHRRVHRRAHHRGRRHDSRLPRTTGGGSRRCCGAMTSC